jgi:hypothetical protein
MPEFLDDFRRQVLGRAAYGHCSLVVVMQGFWQPEIRQLDVPRPI